MIFKNLSSPLFGENIYEHLDTTSQATHTNALHGPERAAHYGSNRERTTRYPNPSSTGVAIRYSLPVESDVVLQLVDVTVATRDLFTGKLEGGTHELAVDTKNLANGTYFVVLEALGKRVTRQLSVVHP